MNTSKQTLKKILYAEDQESIQRIACIALEKLGGYEVKACDNGKEALEAVVDFQPDLLLLDVMMPEMDGPQALCAIRSLEPFKSIPVIFITAKVLPDEIDSLMGLGAYSVIPKPFDPTTLAREIQDIWDEYHGG